MAAFALSCIALLLFLWLSFGGTIPLKPQGYRVHVSIPEAANLATEADVRISGVPVGKVKAKKADPANATTDITLELDHQYAPIPKDTEAILRQKTLLGETYVELAPGDKSSGTIPDSPSEQNRKQSPTRGVSACTSTCTVSFMPSARTITFLWGKLAISSGESRFILM